MLRFVLLCVAVFLTGGCREVSTLPQDTSRPIKVTTSVTTAPRDPNHGHNHGHDHGHNHEHGHEHGDEYDHAPVPAHKPLSFTEGLKTLRGWITADELDQRQMKKAREIVAWLPELAIESDLPKEPWTVIDAECRRFSLIQVPKTTDWESLLKTLESIEEPSLDKPVIDRRILH